MKQPSIYICRYAAAYEEHTIQIKLKKPEEYKSLLKPTSLSKLTMDTIIESISGINKSDAIDETKQEVLKSKRCPMKLQNIALIKLLPLPMPLKLKLIDRYIHVLLTTYEHKVNINDIKLASRQHRYEILAICLSGMSNLGIGKQILSLALSQAKPSKQPFNLVHAIYFMPLPEYFFQEQVNVSTIITQLLHQEVGFDKTGIEIQDYLFNLIQQSLKDLSLCQDHKTRTLLIKQAILLHTALLLWFNFLIDVFKGINCHNLNSLSSVRKKSGPMKIFSKLKFIFMTKDVSNKQNVISYAQQLGLSQIMQYCLDQYKAISPLLLPLQEFDSRWIQRLDVNRIYK